MYRQWLEKMLDSAARGTKARLAEHMKVSTDVISKMLSGIRDISAEELRLIAEFFETEPPGFPGSQATIIASDAAILSMLKRIEGLSDSDINVAYSVIENARSAKRVVSTPAANRDRQQPANRRRVKEPSRH